MSLWSLIFTIGTNNAPLKKGLGDAKRDTDAFGKEIKGMLARTFAAGAMLSYANAIKATVTRFKDLSEQMGVTTDEVQTADFALKQSGMAFEDLAQGIARLGSAREEAKSGNLELIATFEKFGISQRTLHDPTVRTYDIMMMLSKSVSKMNVDANTQADLMELLGSRAIRLSNVLAELSKVKPPTLISKEEIDKVDRLDKVLSRLLLVFQLLGAKTAGPVAEQFTKTLEDASGGIGGLIKSALQAPFRATVGASGAMLKLLGIDKITGRFANLRMPNAFGLGAGAGVPGADVGFPPAFPRVAEWVGPIKPPDVDVPMISRDRNLNNINRASDSLTSVGNFLGSDPRSGMRMQFQQLMQRVQKIEQNTKRIAENAVMIRK